MCVIEFGQKTFHKGYEDTRCFLFWFSCNGVYVVLVTWRLYCTSVVVLCGTLVVMLKLYHNCGNLVVVPMS